MPLMATLLIIATATTPSSASSSSHQWPVITTERFPNMATCNVVKSRAKWLTAPNQSVAIDCLPDEPDQPHVPVKHARDKASTIRKLGN